MHSFGPVGELPVAHVPAGTGILTAYVPTAAVFRFSGYTGTLEGTYLSVEVPEFVVQPLTAYDPSAQVAEYVAHPLAQYDPSLNVVEFAAHPLTQYNPDLQVAEFQLEVLRSVATVAPAGRRMSLM